MSELRDDEIARELRGLSRELDGFRVGAPPLALIETTLARAKRELRARLAARRIPAGFKRELAWLCAAALPPLAMVLAWNAYFLPRLADLLRGALPLPIANGIALAYAGGALLWIAIAAGAIPIAAHRRARLRALEA
jgi:hypothetical protein